MALDDATNAYRVTQADARMMPTVLLASRERRERLRIERTPALSHAEIGHLAALRDEMRSRGLAPPDLTTTLAPWQAS